MDMLRAFQQLIGGGDTYISQRPENLGVRYKKYGPISIIDGPATPESKLQALADRERPASFGDRLMQATPNMSLGNVQDNRGWRQFQTPAPMTVRRLQPSMDLMDDEAAPTPQRTFNPQQNARPRVPIQGIQARELYLKPPSRRR